MQLSFVTMQVGDMAAALSFYQGLLGLSLQRRFSPAPGTDVVFLGGGLTLELICREGQTPAGGDNFSLGFAVDDLEAEVARLTAAGCPCGPILQPADGLRLSFCNDPDGNAVELIEENHG